MTIGWRRRWLARAATGAAIGAAATIAMGIAIGWHSFGDFPADRRAIFAGMFGAFGIVFAAGAVTYAIEMVRPRAVVRIDDQGLRDVRLSPAVIPWSAIAAVVPVQHGMQLLVALDVAAPRTIALPHHPVWRLNRRAARLLGNPELCVRVTGLDADLFAVLRGIEDHRRPG